MPNKKAVTIIRPTDIPDPGSRDYRLHRFFLLVMDNSGGTDTPEVNPHRQSIPSKTANVVPNRSTAYTYYYAVTTWEQRLPLWSQAERDDRPNR